MSSTHSHTPELFPEDFWIQRTVSPLQVLADSHHLYLMHMQFVTFFSQELLKSDLPPGQIQEAAETLADYVKAINSVMNAVDRYMNIKARTSVYKKGSRISSVELFLYLRQRLLTAREETDANALMQIGSVADILLDLAYMKNNQEVGVILENLESAARDSIQGVNWKSIIPSEEEIRLAFQDKETD